MGCRADGMGCHAIEKSRKWDVAQLKSHANGMSRNWEVAQLKCRADGMSCKKKGAQLAFPHLSSELISCSALDSSVLRDISLLAVNQSIYLCTDRSSLKSVQWALNLSSKLQIYRNGFTHVNLTVNQCALP